MQLIAGGRWEITEVIAEAELITERKKARRELSRCEQRIGHNVRDGSWDKITGRRGHSCSLPEYNTNTASKKSLVVRSLYKFIYTLQIAIT